MSATSADGGGRLERLADLIAGSPHNLVSRSDRTRIIPVHIQPSVVVAELMPCAPGARWLDLGTGGGLPGLVCAVVHPRTQFVLMDATRKKVDAVAAFARELDLPNVAVVLGRAEALAHDARWRERFDGVVARAVARLPVLAELARGFLRPGGTLAAVKGPAADAEIDDAAFALQQLRYSEPTVVRQDVGGRALVLVLLHAVGGAPRAFPRPVGVPRAAPLREGAPPPDGAARRA